MKRIGIFLLAVALVACTGNPKSDAAPAESMEAGPDAEWSIVVLNVEGMTCDGCEAAVNAGVNALDGIAEVESDHEAKFTRVKFDKSVTTVEEISAKITETGYEVKGEQDAPASSAP